jgi:hypothetical protein
VTEDWQRRAARFGPMVQEGAADPMAEHIAADHAVLERCWALVGAWRGLAGNRRAPEEMTCQQTLLGAAAMLEDVLLGKPSALFGAEP